MKKLLVIVVILFVMILLFVCLNKIDNLEM